MLHFSSLIGAVIGPGRTWIFSLYTVAIAQSLSTTGKVEGCSQYHLAKSTSGSFEIRVIVPTAQLKGQIYTLSIYLQLQQYRSPWWVGDPSLVDTTLQRVKWYLNHSIVRFTEY